MSSHLHSREYRAFLERLRAARKRANLNQIEVARRLGKTQAYVSKCELGERRIDAVEVVGFAAVYGVSLEELLIDPQHRPPQAAEALSVTAVRLYGVLVGVRELIQDLHAVYGRRFQVLTAPSQMVAQGEQAPQFMAVCEVASSLP